MMVESPSIILVLLLRNALNILALISLRHMYPLNWSNPHLHCIIVRLGIPSY